MKYAIGMTMAFALAVSGSLSAAEYPVSFETIDCNGDSGFVSVDAHRIYKIQNVDCDLQGHKLKQVLITSRTDATQYDVVTLSDSEAQSLMAQLRKFSKARQKALENSRTLIVE